MAEFIRFDVNADGIAHVVLDRPDVLNAMHAPMRKSLGSKRKYLSDEQIAEIAKLHEACEEGPNSKIFANTDFGYRRITVERPLRLRFSVTPGKLTAYQATKGADQAEAVAVVGAARRRLPAEQPAERQARRLRRRIPKRHVDPG